MKNLKNYFETELASMETLITNAYGVDTADIVKEFIDIFYYFEEKVCMEEAFQDFSTGKIPIPDRNCHLLVWLSSANASIKYVDSLLNHGVAPDSNTSFFDLIRMAMLGEIYDVLTFSFDNGLKECMVAKYLMKIGYSNIEENVLKHMTEHFGKKYNYITFKDLFNNALNHCGYDAENCGTKCA